MKYKTIIPILLFFTLVVSCVKKEHPSKEADIESFTFSDDIYVSSMITNDIVEVKVRNADITQLKPIIKVTKGATVYPGSGVIQDFSNNIIYTVTSEDGSYSKKYQVKVDKIIIPGDSTDTDSTKTFTLKYDFEDWYQAKFITWKYPALVDITWQSANVGIATAKMGKVDRYPTRPTTDSYRGDTAVLLETLEGGEFFGNKIPIFSGSVFRGQFKLNQNEVLKSTMFGQIHPKEYGKPKQMTGYYKYTPGTKFMTLDGEIPGKIDEFSLYAVIFKVTKGTTGQNEFLYGDNVLTSDKIIAKAILEDRTPKSEFTKFMLPFVYTEEMDYDLYDYKLTIVFASSKDGDFYRGAIGSTLIVDEVEVECKLFE